MKKFKQLFEESPAADYKPKVDDEEEVKGYKPRSPDEEKFLKLHKIDKKGHPIAPDAQHTGDRSKGKTGKTGEDHDGAEEKGEPILKTYNQFMKMGGHGGDSYKGVGKSGGEKAPVMQGSSKIKEEVELVDEAKNYEIKNGKIHISKANFRKVHKDYKNSTKGKERMMALDPKSGATTSYEVVFEEVELDEAEDYRKDYETFAKIYAKLNKAVDDASAKLKKFPKGNMGMTPDKVKSDPKYKKAKAEYERVSNLTKKFLKGVPKDFMRKYSQSRRLRREETE